MNSDDPDKPPSLLRRLLHWMSVLVLAAVVYDGAIFYSRWSANRAFERGQAAKEAEQERKVVEAVGGDTLKILSFYAAPAVIRMGEHANICYGVNGAKTVRMEPAVENVWPALTRCVQVSPRRDTEYKLIAEDGAGRAVSQSFVLRVRR
jgi:hypothetical protein